MAGLFSPEPIKTSFLAMISLLSVEYWESLLSSLPRTPVETRAETRGFEPPRPFNGPTSLAVRK